MMRLIGSLGLLLLLVPSAASAQSSSVDEKVRYIIEVAELTTVVDTAFDGFRPQMIAQLRRISDKVTPEVADHIANIAADELRMLKPEFTRFAADFYKKELSEEEIDALYAFYRSPVGARVAKKLNKVVESLVPQTQSFITLHFLPKFQARLARDPQLRSALSP